MSSILARLGLSRLVSWPSTVQQHGLVARRMFGAAADAAGAAGSGASGSHAKYTPGPLSFVMFVPSVVCGYLAYWQYERSLWKEGLIKLREEMLNGTPVSVYELEELKDYQKVSCSGRFVHERSLFVGPRPRSIPGYGIQSGYFLVTPLFDPVRRGAVLVNRGWVPASWYDDIKQVASAHDAQSQQAQQQEAAQQTAAAPSSPAKSSGGWFGRGKAAAQPAPQSATAPSTQATPIQVVGVLQPSEQPSAVLPDNIPEKLEFHWIDVPALATAVGLPADTPLVQAISEDPATQQQKQKQANPLNQARDNAISFSGGPPRYPIPKNTQDLVHFTTMPKDHLIYAGIWTSLFIALGLMAQQAVFKPPKMLRMVGDKTHQDLWQNMVTKTK